jgi:hypothetical protein
MVEAQVVGLMKMPVGFMNMCKLAAQVGRIAQLDAARLGRQNVGGQAVGLEAGRCNRRRDRASAGAYPAASDIAAEEAGMDTEHRTIAELLALKDAPDDVLLDQVEAIGERAARHMLCDEVSRLQHTDQATDCAALVDRIDALMRPTSPA